jgi:hypothetical protein
VISACDPGEVRTLEVGDVSGRWLTGSRACKGQGAEAPIGPTKSGKARCLPRGRAARRARHVDPAGRLTRAPLFVNRELEHGGVTWLRAARAIGLGGMKFHEVIKKQHHGDRCDRAWRE